MIPSKRAILILSSISMLALLLAAGQPVEPVRAALPSKTRGENNGLSAQQPGILNCTDTTRIMPLGDSITVGFSSGVTDEAYIVAYRKDLWERLMAWRYPINFVGSREHGSAYESTLGFDPDHEGHGGWNAKGGAGGGIAPNIYNWLVANPADVVLLHIGTNDISGNGQNASEVGEILDEIDRFSEDITVILALIINRNPYSPATTQFNNAVKNMALNRINQIGDKIIIVDMENGANLVYTQQPQGDMWDDKHPYAPGYQKMANVWGNALANLLPVCAVNDSFTVDEDSPAALIDVIANDRGANLQLTETSSASQSGIVSQNGTMIEYQPALNFFGVETFTYKINAGPAGSSRTATVSVTVKPVNDPPMAIDDAFSVPEDSRALLDVLANDSITPDADETLNIVEAGTGLVDSRIEIDSGKIDFTPAPDFFGVETFTYRINDGTPGSNATATVRVTVTAVEDLPRVNQPGVQMNAEGESVSLQIVASDPDGDGLTFEAAGLPSGLVINPANGLISGILAHNSSGDHSVHVVVSDGKIEGDVTVEFDWHVADRLTALFFPLHARRSTGAFPRP